MSRKDNKKAFFLKFFDKLKKEDKKLLISMANKSLDIGKDEDEEISYAHVYYHMLNILEDLYKQIGIDRSIVKLLLDKETPDYIKFLIRRYSRLFLREIPKEAKKVINEKGDIFCPVCGEPLLVDNNCYLCEEVMLFEESHYKAIMSDGDIIRPIYNPADGKIYYLLLTNYKHHLGVVFFIEDNLLSWISQILDEKENTRFTDKQLDDLLTKSANLFFSLDIVNSPFAVRGKLDHSLVKRTKKNIYISDFDLLVNYIRARRHYVNITASFNEYLRACFKKED